MQKFKTLNDVIALAEFAHRNQTDKAGMPYIEHPRRVLANVQTQGALPYVQMAAILHDVTEDTAFTAQMLLDLGVPEAAVTIVTLLDRDASLDEWKMLDPIEPVNRSEADNYYYAQIRKNPGAVQVKLADIGDNLQPWRLSYLPDATQDRLREKYAKAIERLTK
jgi:(p)ppGpp synthase/HD superfamily hydrolase